MRVTTNTRNAVNCIADLAASINTCTSLQTITTAQMVSLYYIEQIFAKLRRTSLVSAVRSRSGGYSITKPIAKITIADIMLAVEDKVDTTGCGGNENCKSGSKCISHDIWRQLGKHIEDFFIWCKFR